MRYNYWMHYAEGSAMPPLLLKLVALRIGEREDAVLREAGRAPHRRRRCRAASSIRNCKLHFGYIEGELAKSAWFAGDEFSAADVQMSFPLEAASHRAGAKELPHIRAFLERIHARPAYQRALERGGQVRLRRLSDRPTAGDAKARCVQWRARMHAAR